MTQTNPEKKERERHKPKIYMNIGLPGSGKTTESRKMMNHDSNIMRINRDDIRAMCMNHWKGKKEEYVTLLEQEAIKLAVKERYSVIIDDTNLNPNTRKKWENLALELKVPFVEKSYLEVSLQDCIERDDNRDKKVGRVVIENMALRYNLIPKPDKPIVIFDIDGTLADLSHRQGYLKVCKVCKKLEKYHIEKIEGACGTYTPSRKDHISFYNLVHEDKPIWTVIDWINACSEDYYPICVSGRPMNLTGESTHWWLSMYHVNYHHLFMRESGDFRQDTIVKQEILDKILKWVPKDQILFTVDDRPSIVEMWKKNGIRCYDVGKGIEF
jgi:predicted kinase